MLIIFFQKQTLYISNKSQIWEKKKLRQPTTDIEKSLVSLEYYSASGLKPEPLAAIWHAL